MKIAVLIASIFLATGALAQGNRGVRIETEDTNIRLGTRCLLNLYGLERKGTCNVAKLIDEPDSVVQVGEIFFRIKRDWDDKRSAEFYRVTGRKETFVANVKARGDCWVGEGVRFCAK